jgi:7-carboxy-7-deazaguanine synthase (Cx14CxxC type)
MGNKEKVYQVKEIYYTIQGEGFHSGSAAVFCRFAGCNLWSGLEKDRASAICKFCDTDFWGTDGENGGKFALRELAEKIDSLFEGTESKKVVFTGGEPALQIDEELVNELQKLGFYVTIETNGTLMLPGNLDWVCVSPKAGTTIIVDYGNELKLVFPQDENKPEDFLQLHFDHFFLQPKEDINWKENTQKTLAYVMQNPKWKLSLQTHKYLNIK